MISPRPYQDRAVERIFELFTAAVRRVLFVLPTGGGKTVIASMIVNRVLAMGLRVVFLAHRRELIKQTFCKLVRNGLPPEMVGVIMAGTSAPIGHLFPKPIEEMTDDELWAAHGRRRPTAPVQVGSIDTFRNRTPPPADLVIVDEAHRALAKSYVDVQKGYPRAWHLGLTATPFRADGKGLGDAYDDLIVGATFAELVDLGALVAPRCFGAKRKVDTSGVRRSKGDFSSDDLARIVDRGELIGDIVEHWRLLGNDAATFAFGVNVAHSQHIAERFRAAGIPAAHVDGNTDTSERDDAIAALREGRTKVVSNCNVFTEGTDVPNVKTIVLARPTLSEGLYRQQAGRGARPFEGREFILLDHAGCVTAFGAPQTPFEVSLEGRKPRDKKTISLPPAKECPECYALVPTATRTCECGFEFPIEASPKGPITEADGKLVELTPAQRSRLDEWKAIVAEWNAENDRRDARDEPLLRGGWCTREWRSRTGLDWPPKGSRIPKLTEEQERVSEERKRQCDDRSERLHRETLERAGLRCEQCGKNADALRAVNGGKMMLCADCRYDLKCPVPAAPVLEEWAI